jgi:hypothetical protein
LHLRNIVVANKRTGVTLIIIIIIVNLEAQTVAPVFEEEEVQRCADARLFHQFRH